MKMPPQELSRLRPAVEAAEAAAEGREPPAPAELAGLLARCRAAAQDDAALELGSRVVELILTLARERGPEYLPALDRK